MPIPSRSGTLTAAFVAAWALAVGGGFVALLRYKSEPGAAARAPRRWPATSAFAAPAAQPTLLVFAHPRCPCTQATVSELARLMTDLAGKLTARVVIVRPAGADEGWRDTLLERRAAGIPGVSVVADENGREAERFHVVASGTALLYDATGALRFSGGITPSRGHEGDNAGRRRISDLVLRGRTDREDAPVFGCTLVSAAGAEDEEAR